MKLLIKEASDFKPEQTKKAGKAQTRLTTNSMVGGSNPCLCKPAR